MITQIQNLVNNNYEEYSIVKEDTAARKDNTNFHQNNMAGFKLASIEENQDGWGPTSVPAQFKDVPFMPYSKGERLGKIADFGQPQGHQRTFQGN